METSEKGLNGYCARGAGRLAGLRIAVPAVEI
jgi:hypothetical protein